MRNRFFQVSARLRTLLSDTEADTPLPLVRPGESLPSATIGEVVTAQDDSGLRPGELVFHWAGWREYAVVPTASVVPIGDSLPDPVAHLGSGWTAYAALTRYGQLRPGETVLVTGGTSGVGSLAGQIARLLGAGRVIGTTGSAAKTDRMRAELGYDTVLVRGSDPIVVPEGVDVVLDNVGGEQLAAAIEAARPGARIVLIGALAGQLAPHGSGARAPVELDAYPIILKGLHIHGLANLDDPALHAEWLARFGGWLRTGEITFPHVRVAGIDNAARTLYEVINGRYVGTAVVEIEHNGG